MSLSKKRLLGNFGENTAEKYLQNAGFEVIGRNYSNAFGKILGEIDIIAKDKKTKDIVFIEVKTRNFNKYFATLPEENISYAKLKKMSKIAEIYLRENKLYKNNYRFDAISVWVNQDRKKVKIKHIESL